MTDSAAIRPVTWDDAARASRPPRRPALPHPRTRDVLRPARLRRAARREGDGSVAIDALESLRGGFRTAASEHAASCSLDALAITAPKPTGQRARLRTGIAYDQVTYTESMTTQAQVRRAKAISFDADSTLWDFQKVMRRSLGIALAELRRRLPCQQTAELTVDRMIEIRNSVAVALDGLAASLEEIRLRAFARVVESVGSRDRSLAEELTAIYLQHRFEDIELYPDVVPALDALAPNYALGLLSNGNTYPERCGLADRFSFATLAQDVGARKPDPRIFLAACAQAGCSPHELIHVGDSLESDVRGANGVRAVSVWLNRDAVPRCADIEPDYEIGSLDGLREVLGLAR